MRPYRGHMSLIQFGQHSRRAPIEPGAPETRPVPSARQAGTRSELVSRAVTLLRAHVNEPVTMVELSRQTGVSERTLRAAFHDVLGLSPKQYAIGQRLHAAHEKYWGIRGMNDFVGDTAERPTLQSTIAMGRHHDQIDLTPRGLIHQHVGGIARYHFGAY